MREWGVLKKMDTLYGGFAEKFVPNVVSGV